MRPLQKNLLILLAAASDINDAGRCHFTEGHKPALHAQSGGSDPLPTVVTHTFFELQGQTPTEKLKKK